MPLRPTPLATALALALGIFTLAAPAIAADDGADPAATELDQVTVTATLNPRDVADTPGTVTVKEREDLERELVTDIRDLVRYEPGVSVANNPGRFGLAGFTIRGIDGNRVLVEIDGVRVPDAFAIGSFANAGRDLVDVDLLKRVEIIRGAASSLYGSNAIGGVVSFQTKDPEDYLTGDAPGHLGVKGGWYGADDGRQGAFTAALGSERVGFLLGFSHREGNETGNQGSNDSESPARTAPNPQRYSVDSALAKLVLTPADGHRLEFAFETGRSSTRTEVFTARTTTTTGPGTVQVLDLDGDDSQQRDRQSLDYSVEPAAGWLDEVSVQAFHQSSQTRQDTRELRRTSNSATGTVTPQERFRSFHFDQDIGGAELLARKSFTLGGSEHRVVAGGEYIGTDFEQLRDGRARNPDTGVGSNAIPPDVFPVRDFPRSRTRETALFVQDEIGLLDGTLSVIPGLRVDRYRLDPRPDPIFADDNPGVEPVRLSDSSVSPKLGALWWFTPTWALTGQYAEGFRAPPYSDVNIGFTNLQFGYTAIANPDLRPEESRSLELGLRGAFDWGRLSLTAYDNRYDDFIESLVALDPSDPQAVPGLITFQSRNLTAVSIRGAEAAAWIDGRTLAPALDDFSLRLSAAYARGQDETANEALASVDPLRLVAGVAYEHGAGWGVELIGTGVRAQTRVPELESSGYAVFDLLAWWRPRPWLAVNGGVFNLADRSYIEWADARIAGLPENSAVRDRFTRPGRNVGLSVRLEY
jgi:hemoglobin/transferrin/lactoferrin receptor protein